MEWDLSQGVNRSLSLVATIERSLGNQYCQVRIPTLGKLEITSSHLWGGKVNSFRTINPYRYPRYKTNILRTNFRFSWLKWSVWPGFQIKIILNLMQLASCWLPNRSINNNNWEKATELVIFLCILLSREYTT